MPYIFSHYRAYLPATGSMHAPITHAITTAVRNRLFPGIKDTSMADKNCPRNMAIVQKLIFIPLLSAVLFFTIRLLNNGVENPKPQPANSTAVHSTTICPDRKYSRNPMP